MKNLRLALVAVQFGLFPAFFYFFSSHQKLPSLTIGLASLLAGYLNLCVGWAGRYSCEKV